MKSKAFITAGVFLTGVTLPALALAQAAAEYGMAASKSAGMASRTSTYATSRSRSVSRTVTQRTRLLVPPAPTKNLQTMMEENRQKLEADSRKGGGSVLIESVPSKATISVNGEPVGQSPMEVKLPEGKHLIELTHPRYEPWQMEVMVSPQESTSVTAQLENKYRSSITLSIR
jgi:hypothetical protein